MFDWKDAILLGTSVIEALVGAAMRGATRDEAIAEARDVLDRRHAIDADVDAAAHPTGASAGRK